MKNDSKSSFFRPGVFGYLAIIGSVAVVWSAMEVFPVPLRMFWTFWAALLAYLITGLGRISITKSNTTTKSAVAPSTNVIVPPAPQRQPLTIPEWLYKAIGFGVFCLLMRQINPNWEFGRFSKPQVPPVGTAYPLPLGSRSFFNLKPWPTATGKPSDLLNSSGSQPGGPMAAAPKHGELTTTLTQVEGTHFRVLAPPGWTQSSTPKNPDNGSADVRLEHKEYGLGIALFAPIPKTAVSGATLMDFAKLHESLKRKVGHQVIAVSGITPDDLRGKPVLRYELHFKTKEAVEMRYLIYVWETKDCFWTAEAFTIFDTLAMYRDELRHVVESVEMKHE